MMMRRRLNRPAYLSLLAIGTLLVLSYFPLSTAHAANAVEALPAGTTTPPALVAAYRQAQHQVKPAKAGFQLWNPENQFTAEFHDGAMTAEHADSRLSLRLEGYGYGDKLATPAPASARATGDRIEYQRGPLTEWYVNEARGLEQGFTLQERPAHQNGGPLEIELSVGGNLQPALVGDHVELRRDGRTVLLYTGVRAGDSAGQSLDARMAVKDGRIRLLVNDRKAVYPITVDPWVQQQELPVVDGAASDNFGISVSISGTTAIVGAPGHGGQGAVYIFTQSGTTWSLLQEITDPAATASDNFGRSVSINGTTAVVGAPGTNSAAGAAYVFTLSGTWTQQQLLTAGDPASGDNFGTSVSLNGSTILIGAPNKTSSQGAAYIFVLSGTWSQQAKVVATTPVNSDFFGCSVSVSGSTALIGAYGRSTNTGGAFIFTSTAGVWSTTPIVELKGTNGGAAASGDEFGYSVSLDGSLALVGAPGRKISGTATGAAYVTTPKTTSWTSTNQTRLIATDGAGGDLFGTSVSISSSAGTLVIGASSHKPSGGKNNQGVAYVFTGSGTTWTQQPLPDMAASDATANDAFGSSVSLSGTTPVIGAPSRKSSQGAAYVFDYTPWTFTSANSTTFTVGTAGTFAVTVTGTPAPALSVNGALPAGVSFTDNGSGSGTLSGMPQPGTGDTYTITITASGTGNSATQTLTLTVDEAPTITSPSGATFTVGTPGPPFQVTATGYPAFPPGTFSETGTLPLNLSFSTGGTLSGKPKAGTGGLYSLTIGATNSVPNDASQPFTLTVDEAPSITSANNATVKVGKALSFAVTASGYPTTFTFSTTSPLPVGITLSPSGALSGTPAVGTGGQYPITIAATNGISPDASQAFTLTVNEPPTITSSNATTFTAGTLGTFPVTASGYPTSTFTETGSLPSGVTLATNGTLSGTPAAGTGGNYPITITAANGVTPKATQSFTLTVDEAPTVTSANHTTFTVGTMSTFTVTASGYPTTFTYSENGALPTGVTLSPSGSLSGTPAAGTGGLYTITITADNGISPPGTQSFTLTVDQAPAITSPNNTTFTVGTLGSFNVTATGYPPPTFTETGALPTGVTLTSAGLLSGTPAVGTGGVWPITITAKNNTLPNAAQSFTLTVNEAPSITSANYAGFAIGAAGSFTVTTLGYPKPSLTETGPLPNGLGFVDNGNGTGTLSGTPLVLVGGNFSISFTAQNGIGSPPTPATQPFTIILGQQPAITSASSVAFTYGVPNSFTVTTTGFPTPSLSEIGGLPAGVTFVDNGNGTGTLSGTPVGAGNYNIVFAATNAVATATQPFMLNVAGLSFSPASLNFYTVYLNTSNPLTLTVTNMDTFTVNMTGMSITPGTADAASYKFVNHCGATLKPNASCTITVTFAPDMVGTLTATLNLTDNAPGSPQQISLSGTAIDPAAQFNPTSVAFGTQSVGSETTVPVQLTNSGLTPLIISNIAITGTNAGEFTQVNNCPEAPESLPSTMSCTISVTFAPTVKGARTGTLTVTDNVAAGKSTVALTGTGD